VDVSRQAEELFGYRREELLGNNAEMLVPPQGRSAFAQHRERFLAAPGPRRLGEGATDLLAMRRDGSVFPVEISLRPLSVEEGSWIASIRDVSSRHRLEEHLRQAQKMEAIGRLAGGVAHDFNNLLGIILGESEMLLDGFAEDDERRESIAAVLAAVERAMAISRQLLSFSRNATPQSRVVDPGDVVRRLEPILARLAGKRVGLTIRAAPTASIRVDPAQLEQVLINLTVNARDAMPAGGSLELALDGFELPVEAAELSGVAPGEYVRIDVVDTGEGTTPEVRSRAFEPFFTTKEAGRGTGLGLATVFAVVNQFAGFLELDSEPGAGTRVSIFFPAVRVAEA
jgi:PAS domain S-box-containing protein